MSMPPRAATAAQPLRLLLAPGLTLCLLLLGWSIAQTRGSDPLLQRTFTTLAWLAGTWLFLRLLEGLVWDRLVPRRGGMRVPRLLRQVVALVLLLLALAVLLSQVWQVSVVPVLATTGALGIIIGLALRNILADFFSGIALNMEHPFGLDDFVLIHVRGKREPVAGFVREVNWRSTTVLTPEDNLISVPNSAVARATVENLSFPSPVSEQELDIVLDWALDQAALETVLGAAMVDAWANGATSGDKPPKFRICKLDGAGVTYKVVYLIDPRKKPKGPARHTLLTSLHRHLRLAGLRPVLAPEHLQGQVPQPQRLVDHESVDDRLLAIAQVPLLAVLGDGERHTLAAGLLVRRVGEQVAVVTAGEEGSSMFVLAAGVLEVSVPVAGGTPHTLHLSPGDIFGEMSLLTGAPRTATVTTLCPAVLYELPREVMATLLAARPALAEALSLVVARHQRRDASANPSAGTGPQRPQGLAESIAARIRAFFGGAGHQANSGR